MNRIDICKNIIQSINKYITSVGHGITRGASYFAKGGERS